MKAGQSIYITIHFVNADKKEAENTLEVESGIYVPNIGENIHNENDPHYFYEVVSKNVFINEVHTHIIIKAKKK
jgi:hypothetical protein